MALCLSCPQPTFPSLAKTAVVSDTVVLSVVVEKDGNVRDVRVTRGHQLLQQAAVDAVRRWRFKPVMLNGEPVEVEAPIPIPFLMN
jgi:protein TonB